MLAGGIWVAYDRRALTILGEYFHHQDNHRRNRYNSVVGGGQQARKNHRADQPQKAHAPAHADGPNGATDHLTLGTDFLGLMGSHGRLKSKIRSYAKPSRAALSGF